MKKIKLLKLVVIIVVIFSLIGIIISSKNVTSIHTLKYNTLLKLIRDDMVDSIRFEEGSSPYTVTIWPKEDAKFFYKNLPYDEYEVEIVDKNHLLDKISDNESISIDVVNKENTSFSLGDILYLVYILFLFTILFHYLAPDSIKEKLHFPSNSSSGRKKVDYIKRTSEVDVTFNDIAGLAEEKKEIQEIVDFLKYPEKYWEMGAEIPKGVLLSGEPGTGKTLLAKAVAGEAGVDYLAASGSEFVEQYVGTGAGRIRDLFEDAREIAPCIVFIDEIDAIGAKRTDVTDGSNEYNQTIEQLLTELDGFNSSDNIIVIAATNRPDCLDPALTRPGRFDRKIAFSLPNLAEREEILTLHAKNKKFMDDVDIKNIAYNSAGYSGAELKGLLNEAAIAAVRFGHTAIYNSDIEYARKKLLLGLEKSNRIISEKDKAITAYHESGHAIVSKFFKSQDSIKEICIIPRGNSGGYTLNNILEDKMYFSKSEFKERITVLLAGRAAEKIAIGDISTGPSNDLEVATKIVQQMIIYYGMDDDIGPISLANYDSIQKELCIGNKISKILKEAEAEAEEILMNNREFLEQMKVILLKQETISGEQFNKMFQEYLKNKKQEANS